jgi:hypothetical protein
MVKAAALLLACLAASAGAFTARSRNSVRWTQTVPRSAVEGKDKAAESINSVDWSKLGGGKRDAQGFLIKEELEFDTSGTDVSTNLGASAGYVEPPVEVKDFMTKAKISPDSIKFADTMKIVDDHCDYMKKGFSVGETVSEPGENEGSSKVFSLARLLHLDRKDPGPQFMLSDEADIEATLVLFGEIYRDVLANPDGDDHPNIRSAMKTGWSGVRFPNGISVSYKDISFNTDVTVGELLDVAEVIEGDDGWDPNSDCWIP